MQRPLVFSCDKTALITSRFTKVDSGDMEARRLSGIDKEGQGSPSLEAVLKTHEEKFNIFSKVSVLLKILKF